MTRVIFALGAAALLAACNTDATDQARADALAQSICVQRGIAPGDPNFDNCRHTLIANRSLIENSGGAMTSSGNAPPTGDITPNPYSTRPSRGVYGSGI
jgi:hypothetical protein